MATQKLYINGDIQLLGLEIQNDTGWLKAENVRATNNLEVNGRRFFIQAHQPSEPQPFHLGDIWIETPV